MFLGMLACGEWENLNVAIHYISYLIFTLVLQQGQPYACK